MRESNENETGAAFGQQLPNVMVPPTGPESQAWIARLAQVECPAITARRDRRRERGGQDPIVWARARGANVEDVDGNVYVDLSAGFAVASVGHAHPRVSAAIAEQAETLIHGMGDLFPTRQKVLLAERLRELTPSGLDMMIFGANGSDAVDAALKTAVLASGKPRVLGFMGGYHGMSPGALGVSGYRSSFREPFRSLVSANELRLPFPGTPGSPWEDDDGSRSLDEIRWMLTSSTSGGEGVGAIIVEPIQGRGGVVAPPEGWLRGLRDLTEELGVCLIFDEIYTGFGRTGATFASQHEGVTPDILCVGKSLGGGLPISACIGTEQVMNGWGRSTGEAIHTSTFLGNPTTAAAALATLDVMESEALVGRSRTLGDTSLQYLQEELRDVAVVREVRGRGLMLGIQLQTPEGATSPGAAVQVMFKLLERGIIVAPSGPEGDVLSLSPPLNIGATQWRYGLEEIATQLRSSGA